MKNSDGTTSKGSKNLSSSNGRHRRIVAAQSWLLHDFVAYPIIPFPADYMNGSTQRKNKNTKNLMLNTLDSQTGSSSSSTSSSHNNLSPISYTSQVPSPLTTITPTSGTTRSFYARQVFFNELSIFSAANDADHFSRPSSCVGHHHKRDVDGEQ